MIPERPRPLIGLLLSGGLDSSILLSTLLEEGHDVQPIYVRSGLIWERAELTAVGRYLKAVAGPRLGRLVVIDLPVEDLYGDHWSLTGRDVPDGSSPDEAVYLPGRNALLVIKAGLWCKLNGIAELALGVLGTNPFDDASCEFFGQLEAALGCVGESPLAIRRPFNAFSKKQVMELGRQLPLELTFSCIAPVDGLHCGECNKCAERGAAFRRIAWRDPTRYAVPVMAHQPEGARRVRAAVPPAAESVE